MNFQPKHLQCTMNTTNGNPSLPVMHYHDTYDLYYIESGKREYFVENKFFTAATGDFILIKPGSFHRIGPGQVVRTLVSFPETFLQQTFSTDAAARLLTCFEKPLITPTEQEQQALRKLLSELAKAKDELRFSIVLAQLLLALDDCTAQPAYDTQISDLLKYIGRNFSEIQSIDQIANFMNLSKQHLCRLFKNAMGITLVQYINQIRVKNACGLLERSDKSLAEIAQLCGFGSCAYFSTVFKRHTGLSPLQYRQQHP